MKTESNGLGSLITTRRKQLKMCSVNDLTILRHDGGDAKVQTSFKMKVEIYIGYGALGVGSIPTTPTLNLIKMLYDKLLCRAC